MSPSPQHVGSDVLRTLHRIHRQINDLRQRLDRGPKRIAAAEAGVVQRRAQLDHARSELEQARKKADAKQLDINAAEEKIKELRVKLNAAQSNEEYRILRESIAAKEMATSVLADEALEAMMAIDECRPKIEQAERHLAAAEQKVREVREQFAQEEPSIRADLRRAEEQLKEAEASLPAEVRELYQRVVRQRGEDALAAIEGEYCGGCQQHIPLNLCNKVMMCEPVFCRVCGRMLYLPEDREPRARRAEPAEPVEP